jgi:ATP/maltotriose-dependent transcriptional regulator MalT
MVLASVSDLTATLPRPRTSLVGRGAEIALARDLLTAENVPLLTLRGPGGVGKTRLALEIAHNVAESFADGVAFVDLSAIRDPALVLAAVADALDVREWGEGVLAGQLAAALFISTVSSHVSHLLAKLGLDSRTAAATFAVRHGLT